jgi:hypothetical protein
MSKKSKTDQNKKPDLWDVRKQALEEILGPSMGIVFHSAIPLVLGGLADVLPFRHFVKGYSYVTADLTGGESGQLPNSLGNYELMMCVKKNLPLAAKLVSQLGKHSMTNCLDAGETMSIGSYFADKTIRALIFCHVSETPAVFKLSRKRCGLLLCIGITESELAFKTRHGSAALLAKLKDTHVFPYTKPNRDSIV